MTIDPLRTAIAEQVPRLKKWEVDGLAKKLLASGLLAQEWIPVTDRLPTEDAAYLVYAPSADSEKPFRSIAWYDPKRPNFGWQGLPVVWSSVITNWQPLPKDPS